jgi:hypothetical protein
MVVIGEKPVPVKLHPRNLSHCMGLTPGKNIKNEKRTMEVGIKKGKTKL